MKKKQHVKMFEEYVESVNEGYGDNIKNPFIVGVSWDNFTPQSLHNPETFKKVKQLSDEEVEYLGYRENQKDMILDGARLGETSVSLPIVDDITESKMLERFIEEMKEKGFVVKKVRRGFDYDETYSYKISW